MLWDRSAAVSPVATAARAADVFLQDVPPRAEELRGPLKKISVVSAPRTFQGASSGSELHPAARAFLLREGTRACVLCVRKAAPIGHSSAGEALEALQVICSSFGMLARFSEDFSSSPYLFLESSLSGTWLALGTSVRNEKGIERYRTGALNLSDPKKIEDFLELSMWQPPPFDSVDDNM